MLDYQTKTTWNTLYNKSQDEVFFLYFFFEIPGFQT